MKTKQENVEMTNQETLFFLDDLKKLDSLTGFDFTMAVADAREHIEREHKIISEKVKYSKEYEEKYQTEIREAHKKFSFKDAIGAPKTIHQPHPSGKGSVAVFDLDPEQEDELVTEIAAIKKKHKVLVDEQEKKEENYQAALRENTTLKKKKFPEKYLPIKQINSEQTYIIRKFLTLHKGAK